jgi:hypothetical protein
MRELKPTLRGAPPDLRYRTDADVLALGSNYTFSTTIGDLHSLGCVEPLGGFDEIASRATPENLAGIEVLVIDLDDLIRIKQHINRPKDRELLFQLLAIKRIREETSRGP